MALAYAPPRTGVARPCRSDQRPRAIRPRPVGSRPVGSRPVGSRPFRSRLTRRGRIAIIAIATLAVVLLGPWRAFAGAPEGAVPLGWTTVTVVPGATLWEMAQSLDPAADPRAIIAEIKAANGLTGSQLSPGQVLLVPSS